MEPKPADKYMYSIYFNNVWHQLNTYLRRPIKKAFTSNSKKLVINVQKNIDKTVESAYPEYVTEQDWRENTEEILSDAVKSMFQGGLAGAISKKPGIVRTN